MNSTKDRHVLSPVTSELAMDEREEASTPVGAGESTLCSETVEQREQWLRKRQMRDRARCAAVTIKQRELVTTKEARLQQMTDRLAAESAEERVARLQ